MALPAYAMGQSSFPELYEQWLVDSLFRPWAELLLDRVGLKAGDHVLDVACGTGIVARLARSRLHDNEPVVGVDVSPQMLAVARRVAPSIDWREGTATALPTKDSETFDVVLCHQGLQFFPDKPAAAGQFKRVLRPGGRLGLGCWLGADATPVFHELQRVAERHVGAINDLRHSLGDREALDRLLKDAGLADVKVETVRNPVRFAQGGTFLQLNTMALVGMSEAGASMSPEERSRVAETIVSDSQAVLEPYVTGEQLDFETSANIVTARA